MRKEVIYFYNVNFHYIKFLSRELYYVYPKHLKTMPSTFVCPETNI